MGARESCAWLLQILGLTIAFYVTARLGLLLAIPPGFATAIWLPSGISLAFILIFGYHVVPAIWLGSFLVNFEMSNSFLIASSIGIGSSLQAMLGAYLIRRFVGFPNPLNNEKNIVLFLALGGPISCLLAASWGCATICLTQQISFNDFLYNWCTWWSGDSIGVLVILPCIMIWTAKPREIWQQKRLSIAVPFVIMFAILIVFIMYTSRWKEEKVQRSFENEVQLYAETITLKIKSVNDFNIKKLIETSSNTLTASGIALQIYDITNENKPTLIYTTPLQSTANALNWKTQVNVAGRNWMFIFSSTKNYLSAKRSWEDWLAPLFGVVLTCLLGSLLLTIAGRSAIIEGVVHIRTQELIMSNDHLVHEIIQRHKMEGKLALHAKELAHKNAELEQFAYVASHDLQEPLRMIVSYLQLLEKQYNNKLDDKAQHYIGYAVDGATRLQALIKDLLAYSRVGKITPSPINCEEIISIVLNNLVIASKQSGAIITYDPLPTVMAESTQLIQLFQNLISNALKFNENSPPRIHISATAKENAWVFSISDNGIGIENENYLRIFAIFQRLHTREVYQGTGIGLAVCKKIVDLLGGKIWVESQLGMGSTFYFSLPILPLAQAS